MKAVRFPFLEHKGADGNMEFMPLMPFQLTLNERQVDVVGLLDTAASVSVLPFSVGLALGAVWEQQTVQLDLVGNLASFEARALLLTGIVEPLIPPPPTKKNSPQHKIPPR